VSEYASQVRFGEFLKGPWAFVYETGDRAEVVLSTDNGKSYGEPISISTGDRVFNPILLPRKDGNLDVYYFVEFTGKGSSLYRRKILRDGTLGAEEPLTSTAVVVDKPHILRLNAGTIFVSLTQIKSNTSDIVFLTLMTDAP
jgi:hypothetical protein